MHLQEDWRGVHAAESLSSRCIYKKNGEEYTQLNPSGFFLAAKSVFILKVEDEKSLNHLVVSIGDKEITVRPGVRAH